MTAEIAGLPFWELTFDAEGDADAGQRDAFLAEVPARGVTDVVLFAHGWNSDRRIANALYTRFFGLLADQLPAGSRGTTGLAGVVWPSQRWADEPIPDFAVDDGGPASVGAPVSDATLDPVTLADLCATFPATAAPLERMANLLEGPATDDAQAEFHRCLGKFSRLAGEADEPTDGEGDADTGVPRMLLDDHAVLFERYRDALIASSAVLADTGGGAAGFGDVLGGMWDGAKEALRQATYWQMKNRSGTVGRVGLGPLLGRLPPGVRVHLVGHSFGARLVSFALAGLSDGPSPVGSVTLLQGAFSHFAFADPLPFDANRRGALAGMLDRIDGPLVACFSVHDGAIGTFYPLASLAAQDDAAATRDALFRWGGMGADGAQGVDAVPEAIRPAGTGTRYRFAPGKACNVDASEVVRHGDPPTGAHSDIVHPELTWVVLAAGGIV